jgi:hypothetical protein
MSKKKTAVPAPVLHGDAFHTFIAEAQSIGNEVAARRAFDRDVGEFLEEQGLRASFEAWRAAKKR